MSPVMKISKFQPWWKEIREKGHGDKKYEPWWPKIQTLEELIEACNIILWKMLTCVLRT